MSRRDPFLTVRIEGGLLPADLLQRLTERPTQGGASAGPKPLEGLTADAYHLPGEKLSEVISASYLRGSAEGRGDSPQIPCLQAAPRPPPRHL